jgi:hypothetical protein
MGEGAVGCGHGKAFLQLRLPVMWGHNFLQCISANNGVLFTRGRLGTGELFQQPYWGGW